MSRLRSSSPGGSGGRGRAAADPDEAVVKLGRRRLRRCRELLASTGGLPENAIPHSRRCSRPRRRLLPPRCARDPARPKGRLLDAEVVLAQLVDLVLADDRDPDRAAADRQVGQPGCSFACSRDRVPDRVDLPDGAVRARSPDRSVREHEPAPHRLEAVKRRGRSAGRRGRRRRRRRARASRRRTRCRYSSPPKRNRRVDPARAGVDAEHLGAEVPGLAAPRRGHRRRRCGRSASRAA